MPIKLTRAMFGAGWQLADSPAFGLLSGQMRFGDDRVVHNGGWYDGRGEKLGWGDFGKRDGARVAREIADGETFYVLLEHDSFLLDHAIR